MAGDGDNGEAEQLRSEVECLKAENLKLRGILTDAGQASAVGPGNSTAGAMGAADRLVGLMAEGGNLLREREELAVEHARLTVMQEAVDDPDLERLLEALREVDALNAERQQLCAERGEPGGVQEVDEFADALQRLRPLLGECDGLRAERESLATERNELVASVEAAGMVADGLPFCQEDRDLELRLQSAVKGVVQENDCLKAEIGNLRRDNARLRGGPSALDRSSVQQPQGLPVVASAEPVPRPSCPAPVPELGTRGANELIPDRPASPQAPGAFAQSSELAAAPVVAAAPLSADVERLQEVISRLQAENASLKSCIETPSSTDKEAAPAAPAAPAPPPPPPPPPKAVAQGAAVPAAPAVPAEEMTWAKQAPPAAPAPPAEPLEDPPATATSNLLTGLRQGLDNSEGACQTCNNTGEDLFGQPCRERHPEQQPSPTMSANEFIQAAGTPAPPAPPAVEEEPSPAAEVPAATVVTTPSVAEKVSPPQAPPAAVKAVKPTPEELLKQAGVPLTPEAMLKQLLLPPSSCKAAFPKTELPPEVDDPDSIAIQRQEAMSHLLKAQLGRDVPEPEIAPPDEKLMAHMPSLDPEFVSSQQTAVKGALHMLFRSFAS